LFLLLSHTADEVDDNAVDDAKHSQMD